MAATVVNNPVTNTSKSIFTQADQIKIQKAIEVYNQKDQEALVKAEIQNKIFELKRSQPGYKYY